MHMKKPYIFCNCPNQMNRNTRNTKDILEKIEFHNELLAIIIRNEARTHGVQFHTPHEFSQQIASIGHPKGKIIPPHVHNDVLREVVLTKEVLLIKQGKLRVDFYDNDQKYLESCILSKGDVILLAGGGHGFEVLEDVEMIEVKQGPYAGEQDKTRFTPVEKSQVIIKDKP